MYGECGVTVRREGDGEPSTVAQRPCLGRRLPPGGGGARGVGAAGERGGRAGRHRHVGRGLGQLGRAQLSDHALRAGLGPARAPRARRRACAAPQLQPPRPLGQALPDVHGELATDGEASRLYTTQASHACSPALPTVGIVRVIFVISTIYNQ